MAAGRGGAGRAAEVTHSGRAGGAGRGAQLWLRAGAVRRRRGGGGGSRYRERRARLPPSPPPPSRFSAGPLHAPPPGEGSTGAQGQAGPVRAWRAGAGPGSLFTSPPGLGGGESGEGLPRGRWEGEKIAPSPHPPNPLFRGVAARPGGDRRRLVPLAGRQRWDCGGQRLPRVREGGWVVARAAGRCWGRSWGGWEARTAERRRGSPDAAETACGCEGGDPARGLGGVGAFSRVSLASRLMFPRQKGCPASVVEMRARHG